MIFITVRGGKESSWFQYLIICFETYIVIIFKCGFDVVAIESINKKAVAMTAEIRRKMETLPDTKIVLVGKIGPRGDSFFPDKSRLMTSKEAEEYHSQQIKWLAATEVDMVKYPHFSNSFLIENVNFLFIIMCYELTIDSKYCKSHHTTAKSSYIIWQ